MGIAIREDELSSDIVVVSENRAKRPHIQTKGAPKKIKACPFCPGNEKMTPPTIMQFGTPKRWNVRCFNNRFPVFSGKGGMHEVVVETNLHSASMSDLSVEQTANVLRTYSERTEWMLANGGMECVLVCKNAGAGAGASLSHPHSQIFGMPFVPPRVGNELALVRKYQRERGRCILCDEMRRAGKRKIMETENFAVVAPRAPRWQYESRIMPKKHAGRLCGLDLSDMAVVLKKLVSAYERLLPKNPDYNYYIRSTPKGDLSLHLHLDFFPRLGVHAGLEEGAGVFINQVSPEKAAELLRKNLP